MTSRAIVQLGGPFGFAAVAFSVVGRHICVLDLAVGYIDSCSCGEVGSQEERGLILQKDGGRI